MPHWEYINSYKPNYLMLLGDNVYGDFNDFKAERLLSAYSKLNKNKYFLNLKRNTEIYAIWDDHDYGTNDGGKNWPFKKKAQSIFLDFFNINKNDIRRKREGIYHTWNIINKIKIKIIALDTRYFKDKFKKNYNYNIKKKYLPDYDISKTILGKNSGNGLRGKLKMNMMFY